MSGPPTHLVVVCCHAIWLGGPTRGASESEWLIAPFQHGETPLYAEHARAGVSHLAKNGLDAALAFSGGPTKKETSLSEAQSYANLAEAHNYWGLIPKSSALQARILIEDRALDSYHNILFSLTLFHATYKQWPARLTIVSHGFKQPRLVGGHCSALGLLGRRGRSPRTAVSYDGIDQPGRGAASAAGVARAEGEWAADPHGRGAGLRGKREARNPGGTWQGVFPEGVEGGDRGGLRTRGVGADETVVEEERMPWAIE